MIKFVFRSLFFILMFVILAGIIISAYTHVQLNAEPDRVPTLFGIKFISVSEANSYPGMNDHDLVVLREWGVAAPSFSDSSPFAGEGQVLLTIPFGGYITAFFMNPVGIALLLSIPAIFLLIRRVDRKAERKAAMKRQFLKKKVDGRYQRTSR